VDAEALRELEPDFWRAPSAHNTQPWVLRYGNDAVEVGWDPARALRHGDPTGRDLRLSLGAFVECCLIVCAGAGLAVDFEPCYDEPGLRAGRLAGGPAAYATPFAAADVRRRITSRVAYHPGALSDDEVAELCDLARAAGGDVRLEACRKLRRMLAEADQHLFGTPPVARELRRWLRLTPRHPRYRLDGLTDQALDLSRFEASGLRAVLAPGAYGLLRRVGLGRLLAAASRGLLDYDGQVLVLIAPPGCGPEGQVAMGRVLLRQWLALARRGYATHPLSQILDCGPTRDALAVRLGIGDPERLLSLVRVGRPAAPAARSFRRVGHLWSMSHRPDSFPVDGSSTAGAGCRRSAVAPRQETATVILPAARPSSMARCAVTISSKPKTRTGLAW
jgi:hypothetical protein